MVSNAGQNTSILTFGELLPTDGVNIKVPVVM